MTPHPSTGLHFSLNYGNPSPGKIVIKVITPNLKPVTWLDPLSLPAPTLSSPNMVTPAYHQKRHSREKKIREKWHTEAMLPNREEKSLLSIPKQSEVTISLAAYI